MTVLLCGLILFITIHLIKPLLPRLRGGIINRIGEAPYKIVFSILSAIGLLAIIFGYKQSPHEWLWAPLFGAGVTMLLMLPATALVVAAYFPNSWGRHVKHPMLIGALIWAGAHLATQSHLKGIMLFGGFFLFAVIVLCKADWHRSVSPKPLWLNVAWLLASKLAYIGIRYVHIH